MLLSLRSCHVAGDIAKSCLLLQISLPQHPTPCGAGSARCSASATSMADHGTLESNPVCQYLSLFARRLSLQSSHVARNPGMSCFIPQESLRQHCIPCGLATALCNASAMCAADHGTVDILICPAIVSAVLPCPSTHRDVMHLLTRQPTHSFPALLVQRLSCDPTTSVIVHFPLSWYGMKSALSGSVILSGSAAVNAQSCWKCWALIGVLTRQVPAV